MAVSLPALPFSRCQSILCYISVYSASFLSVDLNLCTKTLICDVELCQTLSGSLEAGCPAWGGASPGVVLRLSGEQCSFAAAEVSGCSPLDAHRHLFALLPLNANHLPLDAFCFTTTARHVNKTAQLKLIVEELPLTTCKIDAEILP